MLQKYLNGYPIAWLLESDNPSIEYLVRRDILGVQSDDQNYAHFTNQQYIKNFLSRTGKGILGDLRHFDLLYRGSLWCFAESVIRGLDKRTPEVNRTVEALSEKAQCHDGGFSFNWSPLTAVGCITGDMVFCMIEAGYRDDRVERGLRWIIEHQRHDGGWRHCPLGGRCDQLRFILLNKPGKGLSGEYSKESDSCVFATASCARALLSGREILPNAGDVAIRRAAAFILRNSFFMGFHRSKPSCYHRKNPSVDLLGIPVLAQYDLLMGLDIIARAGFFMDRRVGEFFNGIMAKQNEDGSWNLEQAEPGMLFGNVQRYPGGPSEWVTLRILRFLAHIEKSTPSADGSTEAV